MRLSRLELNKIFMHEFWCDYVKPKYDEKAKLCFMDTDSFIVYKKNQIFIKTLQKISETRFQNQNYELDRSLSKRKDKKSIGLMTDELCRKIMTKSVGLAAKTCS